MDGAIDVINKMSKDTLWIDESPLWARPEVEGGFYQPDYLQVVGHTPVKEPTLYVTERLLVCDTFSTYRNGEPIGNQKFVWVDTNSKQIGIAGSDTEGGYLFRKHIPGRPRYQNGEMVMVEFRIRGTDDYEVKSGIIRHVDAYGTFGQNEEPSYDITVSDGEEKCLYKHVRESQIVGD